jgi:choline dehydrogenase-like flavoprotein
MQSEKNLPPLEPQSQSSPVAAQRTTLAFDVLARFFCNTWDEAINNGGAPFDVIVIGAGMYGGYMADKLFRLGASLGLRILVLEAGPFLVPEHLQNLPNLGLFEPGVMDPRDDTGEARNFVWGIPWRSNGVPFVGQAFCVGGKSVYWGGWCPRLEEDDLAKWPPEVATYLKENYETIEKQTGVFEKTDFIQGKLYEALIKKARSVVPSDSLTSVEEPPLAVQGNGPASGLFGFDKFSSALLLLEAVRDAANDANDSTRRLFLVPNAHVAKLRVDRGAVRQLSVHINGALKTLDISPECFVVLASGAIESTRLALDSLPREDRNSLMGRNLMVHLRTNTLGRIRKSVLENAGSRLPEELQTAALLVRGKTPDGNFHFQVTASADPNPNPNQPGDADKLLYRMLPDMDQVSEMLASQRADWISIWVRGVGEKQGDKEAAVPRDGGNWINLSPFERDEYGIPRAFVRLEKSAAEGRLHDSMDQAAVEFIQGLGDGDPNNSTIDKRQRDGLGSTYHESGTLWMGDDPDESVTDVNGRFHHVVNTYCIDQAIFPTVGSANPVLTGLALTRKAAEHLVGCFQTKQMFPDDARFTSLFDGSSADLTNWKTTNGRPITTIQNIFELNGGPLAILYFKKQSFKDFVLRLQWKYFSSLSNSGVFLRMPKEPPTNLVGDDPYYSRCVEIQIDQTGKNFDPNRVPQEIFGSSRHKTGAVYGVEPARSWRATQPSKDGTEGLWNNFEITAVGANITVELNGHVVCEATTTILDAGYVGLQYHTDRIQFRNIAIREV